jgi:hypothetical protein
VHRHPFISSREVMSKQVNVIVAKIFPEFLSKNFNNNHYYTSGCTIYQSIFSIRGNSNFFDIILDYISSRNSGVCGFLRLVCINYFFTLVFTILVRKNYFFVLHALFVAYEITVLPLKISWND